MKMPIRTFRLQTVLLSFLVFVVVCIYVFLQLNAPYISPGVVSLQPWVSVLIIGPFATAVGAWFSVDYCNPMSPISMPTVPLSSGKQALIELVSFILPVYLAFLSASFITVPLVSLYATGGEVDWARVTTAFLAFSFFPIFGFLIGVIVGRLWAVPFAFFLVLLSCLAFRFCLSFFMEVLTK